jgi:hypothetical protein
MSVLFSLLILENKYRNFKIFAFARNIVLFSFNFIVCESLYNYGLSWDLAWNSNRTLQFLAAMALVMVYELNNATLGVLDRLGGGDVPTVRRMADRG